jgi:steroid delta-isomerase-like uncharacterized protein
MSTEENKNIVRRFLEEGVNKRNFPLINELVADEHLKQASAMVRTGFPDFHITIEDMLAEGNQVAARLRIQGTNEGVFRGFPATGKQGSTLGLAIYRIENGRIVESWLLRDDLGLLQELGAIPRQG